MVKQIRRKGQGLPVLAKAPSGIQGLDEITGGGLPRGRPTLVTGGAGSGKTLLAMELLVRGATEYDEPGLFVQEAMTVMPWTFHAVHDARGHTRRQSA